MFIIDSWQSDIKALGADDCLVAYEASMVGKYPNYTHIKYKAAKFDKYVKGEKKGEINPRKKIKGSDKVFFKAVEYSK